jgi:hypothetical protein
MMWELFQIEGLCTIPKVICNCDKGRVHKPLLLDLCALLNIMCEAYVVTL